MVLSLVKVGPVARCCTWSHPPDQPQTNPAPPPAAFINHSSAASVTCLFVWALTELQPAAALRSGMWPPLTLTYPTSLPQAVTQQPPITNNNGSPRLRLALSPEPSLEDKSPIKCTQVAHKTKQSSVQYISSHWCDVKHEPDVYHYSLSVIVHRNKNNLPFSILTATVTASLGLSLSMPRASAITTWPKQPSPRGLPRVNLQPREGNTEPNTRRNRRDVD